MKHHQVLGRLKAVAWFAALLVAVAAGPAAAQLNQFGIDPRERVDLSAAPWRSVGKLQTAIGGQRATCTGALVGPRTVLSAAHCLYNARTGKLFSPSSMHFLIGFEGASYAGHAGIAKIEPSPDYDFDPARSGGTRGSDWAILTLDAPLATVDLTLPIDPRLPPRGTPIMVGGYAQDHPNVLTADQTCHITGLSADRSGHKLVLHDCSATHGVSGAPVLYRSRLGWTICGVNVARSKSEPVGLATLVDEVAKRL